MEPKERPAPRPVTRRDEEVAAHAELLALVREIAGEGDVEPGIVEALYGSACGHAAALLNRATRVGKLAGRGADELVVDDLRLAADMNSGQPVCTSEMRLIRDQCNNRLLPDVSE